ncbi:vWA domain-containing protein [Planctomycetota bacterium]
MSYEKLISQALPGLIVLIMDDSGSMGEKLSGTSDAKYKWVERYIGIILDELLKLSTEVRGNDAVIKQRYYVYVIKYGSKPEIWGGSIMDIEAAIKAFTDAGNSLGLGGNLGGTDAKSAFQEAYNFISQELSGERFKDSFPPMVFHLTDGESWSDPTQVAEQIQQLATSDGNALVVNAYIGTQTSLPYQGPEDFPGYLDVTEAGPGSDNIRLFNMSSEVPEGIENNLKEKGIFPQLKSNARLFFDVRTKDMLKHVIQVIGSMESRMAR